VGRRTKKTGKANDVKIAWPKQTCANCMHGQRVYKWETKICGAPLPHWVTPYIPDNVAPWSIHQPNADRSTCESWVEGRKNHGKRS
jgi:hypothetical protein